jgi:hypothetical protein
MRQTFSIRFRLKVAQILTEFCIVRLAFEKLRHRNMQYAISQLLEAVGNNIRSIHVRIATWNFHIYRIRVIVHVIFIVYLRTLSATQNMRCRMKRVNEKLIGDDLEGHCCIPIWSTLLSFAKATKQNRKKPRESGHNEWYVTSRTHVRSTTLLQYVATRCDS